MNYSIFASESVCAGHPDKICDQVSDAIVDAALVVDPFARVAVETAVKKKVLIFGEVTCSHPLEYEKIARRVIGNLGYTCPEWGFS
ncbi:S-adenosylmethionine synthetase N-terminal domain-containing protein, partial [Patescibacteria group bacterium]